MLIWADIDIAARTVFGEARGEPYDGKKAVVHVLINRWQKRVGDADHSLSATALRWLQFSAWNENDPNRSLMQGATVNDPRFRECLRAVLEAIDESDPTMGSRHYMSVERRRRGWPRDWGPEREPVVTIGGHHFYNNVA